MEPASIVMNGVCGESGVGCYLTLILKACLPTVTM